MATRTKTVTAPKPGANPHSWLLMRNDLPDLAFGMLERTYLGRTNTVVEFLNAKLHPTPSQPGGPAVTAEKVDVILPHHGDDRWRDPLVLAVDVDDAARVANKPTLVAYSTLYFPDVARAHHAWRQARRLAERLAEEHEVATIIVQHVPGRAGSPNPIHCHLLTIPRKVKAATGLAAYCSPLCSTAGADLIHKLWKEVSA